MYTPCVNQSQTGEVRVGYGEGETGLRDWVRLVVQCRYGHVCATLSHDSPAQKTYTEVYVTVDMSVYFRLQN